MKEPFDVTDTEPTPETRVGAGAWLARRWARWSQSKAICWGAFATLLLGTSGLGVLVGSWTRACAGTSCPSIAVLESYRPTQTAKVYAADGRLITELGIERRTVLALEEISPALRAAFIAMEDQRFFQHGGIDFRRILGAARANLRAGEFAQGFSSITMQLARNVFPVKLPSTKNIRRKVREMRVALEIERTYSKERIFELYLNQLFLGGNAYGVEAGALRYFGKSARDLNIGEAALLAGMPPAPNYYNPRRYPENALERRNVVLNVMRDQGYLTAEQAEQWKAYPLEASSREDFEDVSPYFVEWVRRQIYDRFGTRIYDRGLRVYTTLDLDMQMAAERAVEEQLERIESGLYGPYSHITYAEDLEQREPGVKRAETPYLQGALVALDSRAGYVRAMVGGRDYSDSEFNRATQALRQAGSTFKPFVYTAAIRSGVPLSHMIDDSPISLREPGDSMPWEPVNFELDYRGPMTLRKGLRQSRNLVAIKLGMELGVQAVIGEARRFGISTPLYPGHSLHIGAADVYPIEMASAYTAFANLGTRVTPLGILRVEDDQGNILWEPQARKEQIIDEEHMWLANSLLQTVMNQGTGATAVRNRGRFPHPGGGKTGTTNEGSDVWFIGFTSELVAAVWIGLDQPKKIKANSAGGVLAAPVWAAFMNDVYERRPAPAGWDPAESLVLLRIDHETGYLATGWCPRESTSHEWFIPGTEPTEYCPVHNPFAGGISRPSPRDHDDGGHH